jgi:PAS domain S-box-containing protein
VYHVLRALDHEPDALIDNIGINRVLERGRLVTLTRDYSTSTTLTKEDLLEKDKQEQQRPSAMQGTAAAQEAHKATTARGRASLETSDPRLQQRYEEYEQYPSSPWAQSPAPSPAIQNDADANPFFTTGNVDEETFNPSRSPQDYAQYGMVEAIGVDRASTVTHIPLVHPTLSQAMASTDTSTPAQTPVLSRRQSEQSTATSVPTEGFVRKAPIAILSILSPVVPYPRNLTNSLKHLGPHLATSFSNAWQFTNAQAQVASVRHRRTTATTSGGLSIPSDSDSLDDLLHLDLEDITTSVAGSVTSPSDYSGRSRHSPGGSISGTPGWTIGGTPGHLTGTEAVESYFDARKQYSKSLNPPASNAHEQPVRKSDKRHPPKRVTVNPVPEQVNEDVKPRNDNVAMDDLFSTRRGQLHGSSNHGHSLLHSYGADFSSSFQSLPAATTPGGRPQARLGLARRPSITESFEMPPPSESLLRTIIDSLPVQIFTAAPSTGAITWVNSKFLIYRGQDSRQVLQDPWDSIHPEDRASYLEEWSRSLRTGQQLQKKVRLQRFDDCYRWFYVRVAPLKNKRQQIVHWIGTNMDFHEQHLAEQNSARQQETAASEAKYRALANSSPQIVFVVSDRRGLTFSNLQWITYSGQSEVQALGNGFLEHVHPPRVG